MLRSRVFACRHVNLPLMRGKAPTQLQETVAEHTKRRKRTEEVLIISLQDRDRVSQCQTPSEQAQHLQWAWEEAVRLGHGHNEAKEER